MMNYENAKLLATTMSARASSISSKRETKTTRPLADGTWEKKIDVESGASFYYHPKSNTSSWILPPDEWQFILQDKQSTDSIDTVRHFEVIIF